MKIVMQVGSELRINNNGDVVIDNPELELAGDERAADAALLYRFDPEAKVHVIRLLDPVADRKHLKSHAGTTDILFVLRNRLNLPGAFSWTCSTN